MNRRLLVWAIGSLLFVGVATAAILEPFGLGRGAVLIAGDKPVTEDQIRQRLQSEGYTDLQIVRQGRYFEVTGSKEGATSKIEVDSQTGRLRDDDDD